MRRAILGILSLTVVAVCGFLAARPQETTRRVRLQLVDGATGKPLTGMIRIRAKGEAKPLPLAGLYPRLKGVKASDDAAGWHVIAADGGDATLPRGPVHIEAFSGLETGLTRLDLDLTREPPNPITLKLDFLFRPEERGLVAGNTHLHLMKMTEKDADEYLRKIPPADRLSVLFLSYLERNKDDLEYITNRYPIGDLADFKATGVLFNNGEEHRHNFKGYGEGYGHVMFLNLKQLVKPVSLGPGITGAGFDDVALRTGIDAARKQGATVIWCHNGFGFEDVVNALTGRLDALNVFDGSRRGSYDETYYRFLNLGMRLPLSTGTDWFLYDFQRVYAKVAGKLTVPAWLDALKAGRCQATNGPLLELRVDGKEPGDVINLAKPAKVKVQTRAVGRHDFQNLQLVLNGKVVHEAKSERMGRYQAAFTHEVRIEQPGWLALRIEGKEKNELDQPLFAHTSPVYVDVEGRRVFDVDSAQALLKMLEEGQAAIRAQGHFSNPLAGQRVTALYDDALRELRERVQKRR